MKKHPNIKPLPLIVAAALTLASCSSLVNGHASAATLGQTTVRLNRLAYSTNTGGRVCAKPTTTATETSVAVTFPTNAATDYVVNATPANWVATGVADTSYSPAAVAWPGLSATAASSVSGKTVTWTSGDLTVGTLYCFDFNPTNAASVLTTASNNTENVTGTVQTQTSGNTPSDTGSYSIGLASGTVGQGDQVAITGGVVPPTFKFTINSNTDAFSSNISLGTVAATAGRTITVTTNAANGYVVWAKDNAANGSTGSGTGVGSLLSATASFKLYGTAAVGTAARTLTAGTQDYGMGATVTGVATPLSTYNGASSQVGTLDPGNFQPIVSATAPTASDVITVTERAASSTTTKAASDYADTINFTGAGLF